MCSLTRADLTIIGIQNITTLAMLYKQDPLSDDINIRHIDHPVTNETWPTLLKDMIKDIQKRKITAFNKSRN